jgi:hypothetical protein
LPIAAGIAARQPRNLAKAAAAALEELKSQAIGTMDERKGDLQ